MKKVNISFKYCFIIFLVIAGLNRTLSQQVQVVIDSVSIDPNTGSVIISWEPVDNLTNLNVEICRLNLLSDPNFRTCNPLDTISTNDRLFYIDPEFNLSRDSASYRVAGSNGTYSGFHKAMYLKAVYDSCDNAIELKWFKYKGWDNIEEYKVIDFITGQIVGATSDTNYVIPDVEIDRNYSYYIRAVNSDQKTTSSNRADIDTEGPDHPTFIVPGNVIVNNGDVELSFVVDPNSQLSMYNLYRLDNDTILLKSFTGKTFGEFSFIDTEAKKDGINHYQLIALDACNNHVFLSDTLKNMVLSANKKEDEIYLTWTAGNIWNTLNNQYIVLRDNENNLQEEIARSNESIYIDNISAIDKGIYDNEICYKVLAKTEILGKTYTNNSNVVCVEIEPEIFVPLVFTPDGDGINDFFIPEFSFIPLHYEISVIDRSGRIVFQSKDPSEKWDGAEELPGTFVYTIIIEKENGKKIKKAGYISLIRKAGY